VDRRTVLKAGVTTVGTLAMPAYLRAQSNKKLSILTWNIADQEALFKEEFADFQKANPGVEIEWLDKKGPAFRHSTKPNLSRVPRRTSSIFRVSFGWSGRSAARCST
jgi:hypothetical protein